jgi:hypothetical protein
MYVCLLLIPRLLLADYKAVFGATLNHLIGGLLVHLVMTSPERLAIIGSHKTCMRTCMHVAFGGGGGSLHQHADLL